MAEQFLMRRRDAAHALAMSEAQLVKWEREGVIRSIGVPGTRARRYRASDVRSLATNIGYGRLEVTPVPQRDDPQDT